MRPSARGRLQFARARASRSPAKVSESVQADDRLNASLGHAFGKFERAEQIVGVGQRQRRRPVGPGQRGELRDGERAFEQRIG